MTDPTQLKDRLLKDPDTQSIAKALGIPLEEYVAKVVAYARDPNKEPELDLSEEQPGPSDTELNAMLAEVCNSSDGTENFFTAHQRPLMII